MRLAKLVGAALCGYMYSTVQEYSAVTIDAARMRHGRIWTGRGGARGSRHVSRLTKSDITHCMTIDLAARLKGPPDFTAAPQARFSLDFTPISHAILRAVCAGHSSSCIMW